MRDFTRSQHHLIDWLSREDSSAIGECQGKDLDWLVEQGLATCTEGDTRGREHDRVSLTDEGYAEARRLGEWSPRP